MFLRGRPRALVPTYFFFAGRAPALALTYFFFAVWRPARPVTYFFSRAPPGALTIDFIKEMAGRAPN